jgi:sterol desaturase/sphingolipid hydroxylase (fatty acid hydroxylase superfamily)
MWLVFIAGCAFAIELAVVGWTESSLRKILRFPGTVRNDVFAIFLNYSGIGSVIALLMTFALIYFPVKYIRTQMGAPVLQMDSPLIAGLVWVVVADFSMYWFHRLAHHWSALWAVHSFHHSASDMTVLSGVREHPLIYPLMSIWMILPTALIAPQKEAGWLLAILVAGRVHTLINHSNIVSDWGIVGRFVLVSPAMHRIHHGLADEFHDKNFGTIFTAWDRLFGTWKDPRCIGNHRIPVGLAHDSGAVSPWVYLMQIYASFVSALLSPIKYLFKFQRRA